MPFGIGEIAICAIGAGRKRRSRIFVPVKIFKFNGKFKIRPVIDDIFFRVDLKRIVPLVEIIPRFGQEGDDLAIHFRDLHIRIGIERRLVRIVLRDGSRHGIDGSTVDPADRDLLPLREDDELADGKIELDLSVYDDFVRGALEDLLADLRHTGKDLAPAVLTVGIRLIDGDVVRSGGNDGVFSDGKVDDANVFPSAILKERVQIGTLLLVVEFVAVRDHDQPFFRISAFLFQIAQSALDGRKRSRPRIGHAVMDLGNILLLMRLIPVDRDERLYLVHLLFGNAHIAAHVIDVHVIVLLHQCGKDLHGILCLIPGMRAVVVHAARIVIDNVHDPRHIDLGTVRTRRNRPSAERRAQHHAKHDEQGSQTQSRSFHLLFHTFLS